MYVKRNELFNLMALKNAAFTHYLCKVNFDAKNHLLLF